MYIRAAELLSICSGREKKKQKPDVYGQSGIDKHHKIKGHENIHYRRLNIYDARQDYPIPL